MPFRNLLNNLKQAPISITGLVKNDWRAQAVIILTVIVGAATLLIYLFAITATKPENFGGAVFAGWVAGYFIFVLGLFTVLVSLTRPEQDFFESRARMLLRGQEGPHINYILAQMNTIFQPYIQDSRKHLTVNRYNAAERKFHIIYNSVSTFRSFLNDIETHFPAVVEYGNGAADPKGETEMRSSLAHIRINGEDVAEGETFAENFSKGPYPVSIPAGKESTVEHRFNCWVVASEEANRHTARRFTRHLEVIVTNDLPGSQHLVIEVQNGTLDPREILLRAGRSATIINLLEISPGQHVYDFRIRAVEASVKTH